MKRFIPTALLVSTMLVALPVTTGAQELVTTDRVGSPDAPNVLTERANPNQSPNSPSAGLAARLTA
jgi:hypothetical protein